MGGWNPWQDLAARDWIRLGWARLPGTTRGLWLIRDGQSTILLDSRLDRRQRRATLGHELVHEERGIPTIGVPAALAAKEEAIVERITATRLVPLAELRDFARARAELGPVMAADVAEEFDVFEHVARVACELAR